MSTISIVRVGEGHTKPILISDGKTVIGRGPFLQVTDKRVSRNHGVLEVSDGKLYLTPTHTNPCFFKKTANSTVEIMKKDDRRMLENGQIFGLLPDSLYFKVQCPVTQNGTNKSKAKSEEEEEEVENSEEEEESVAPQKPRPWQTVKTEDGKEMTLPVQKKRVLPTWMAQIAKSAPAVNKPASTNRQIAKSPAKRKANDDDYSPAKRKTPARGGGGRRRKTESEEDEDYDMEEDEEEEKVTSKRGHGSSKKKYYAESDSESEEDWEAEEEYKPKKRAPAKSRRTPKAKPKPRRRARESSEEISEEDLPKKNKRGGKSRKARGSSDDEGPSTSRPTRAARAKRKSYVDDFVDFSDDEDVQRSLGKEDEDSDFVLEEIEESGSDWEMEGRKSSQKKNQRTPSRRSSRTVGRRKKYADSDESLSDDEYVPRSTRKRQSSTAKRKGHRRQTRKSSSEEEESSSDDYVAPKRDPKTKKRKDESESEEESEEETPKKKTSRKTAKKKDVSDSEEDEKRDKRDDVKKVRQLKSKHRPPCMFGKKCYRKNPEHFAEFSHPGDVSYDEQSDLDDDDDKPDCPYGSNCYRTNASHQKQYKHYVKKEAKPDARLPTGDKGKDEEESTGPNTYDYNDSFINDETQNQSEGEEASESGQDASEDEEEDIKELKKEAKDFVRNEKMTKPV